MKPNKLPFIIYFAVIVVAIALFRPSHLTTNMLSIFEHDENIEKLQTLNSFENTSMLFVTIEGFNPKNLNRLKEIEKKLKKSKYIKETKLNLSKIEISDYIKKNYYLLSEFKPIPLDNQNIKERLTKLRASLVDSFLYQPIDKNDPFKLFDFNIFTKDNLSKDGYLRVGDYGYLLTAKLKGNATDMRVAKEIEQSIKDILADQSDDVVAFSNLFFTAQNSTYIKKSVNTIMFFSFGLLIVLFFITLRDYKVLIATMLTLGGSIFVALAISSFVFEELSIFALAFGSAISSISVDYLFHNYFHRQYLKKGINKSIFIAFLTTALGFVFLQFVSFPLIVQLSFFALVSLSFSYFQFTFIYPYFKFAPKENRLSLKALYNIKPFLPVNLVFIFSIVAIIYAGFHIRFDYDLKNLDYDNQSLKAKQAVIQNNMPSKSTILIEANSIDELIEKASILQKKIPSFNSVAKIALSNQEFKTKREKLDSFDFKKLKELLNQNAKAIGFKDGYFMEAYSFTEQIPKSYSPDLEAFKDMGYEIIKRGDKFYTIATMNKNEKIEPMDGVYIIDAKELIKSTTQNMFDSLLLYLSLSFVSVFIIIAWVTRAKTILALDFILFPIAMILLYLSFVGINIMHLFSIIIIIVAGIDYGIYMSSDAKSDETKEAIFYSLLTSFSGFGILVFSSIGAMHSIGVVITIGILAILLLVISLKSKPTYNQPSFKQE
ncbi:MAG: hypothetical protein GXO60_07470 [Epsilonproteobacteria bacterium]|nr:hypothetical protein [Campylobacterota bacterium]